MVFKVETLLRNLNHSRSKIHTFKYKNPSLCPTYLIHLEFSPCPELCLCSISFPGNLLTFFYNRDNLNVYAKFKYHENIFKKIDFNFVHNKKHCHLQEFKT